MVTCLAGEARDGKVMVGEEGLPGARPAHKENKTKS